MTKICKNCGNPEIMYWCNECENSEEEDTCSQCGKTILEDKDYHKECPPLFNPDEVQQINTPEEARQYAIDWQNWVSEQNQIGKEKTLYQSDMNDWHAVFTELATRFNLTEEFKENGIV